MNIAAIFGDHMVLQQGVPLPVWGWAEPGKAITVSFAGQTATAVTDPHGRWQTRLAPLAASSEPRDFVVSSNRQSPIGNRQFRDVLVGEVWLGSGQSNMQWAVRDSAHMEREIREANHPQIRLFTVPNVAQVKPTVDIRAEWSVCSPDTIAPFSATAYFFGRELQARLGGVPVGLINDSWGGTRIEAWMSRAALGVDPASARELREYEEALAHPGGAESDYARRLAEYAQWEKDHLPQDAGNTGYAQGWAQPGLDLAGWREMRLPGYWQAIGHTYSGVFWFRRDVEIPALDAGRDLVLALGPVDKSDDTYFNNELVGRVARQTPNCWALPRDYMIPGRLVKAGRNTIAVRVLSDCWAGGFAGNPPDLSLTVAGSDQSRQRLDGPWQYRIEQNFGQVVLTPSPLPPYGDGNANSPCILYDSMIKPVAPYPIRGALWYQGESNAAQPQRYGPLLAILIRDWRQIWGDDLAFLFVQLPNHMARAAEPGPSAWAELREGQLQTLALPKTGMAITIELGEETNIHPVNKQDVGKRLALSALGTVYGQKDVVPSGPLFKSWAIEGATARLRFEHVGGGLVARGGKLTGFSIAGKDRKFVWAEARIDKATVVVSSPKVKAPVAVRYAWADNPDCSLYNKEGLPASPFRTDKWEH